MNRKKFSLAIILATVVVLVLGTALIAAANPEMVTTIYTRLGTGRSWYEPPVQRNYVLFGKEDVLEYKYTTELDENSLHTPVNSINGSFTFHTYETPDSGREYTYDNQNRLYSYFNTTEHPDYQASELSEEACLAVMEQFLADNGIDSAPYTQREWVEDGLQYEMSIPGGEDQRDEITGHFQEDGSLFGVLLYHNDVTSVSNSDKSFFEEALENYLTENNYTDTITQKTVSYRRLENTLVAYYSLTFQDRNGGAYANSFVIGKDKLFW